MACFHFKICASIGYKLGLLPTRLVTEVPCGLAHRVGKVTCFHFKSCVSYTIANQTGFRGSLLPGCLAHHAGKKGLAFTARALLSLGLSQSIANRAGFGASLWLEESILTYAPFAPSSPHPVVFCCWTFWKGASCVCTTLLLTDVLERGWARSSAHHGAKHPRWESSPKPLLFSLML